MLNKEMIGLSMFSSAGIAETYLKDLNINIVQANELKPERAEYYKHFYPNADMICGDITEESVYTTFIEKAKALNPKFLLATPPCQGMSTLGKKDYENDSRNNLIFRVFDVMDSIDLDIVVIENVPKFLKLKFPYKDNLYTITEILKDKYGSKYRIEVNEVNAKDYGVPQSRPRSIIILHKDKYKWEKPQKESEITLREAIGNLPSLANGEHSNIKYHYALNHSDMQIECMSHTAEGCSAMSNPVYYPKKANGEKVKGFHNTYKRMRWDLPCPARATNSGLISGHNNVHPGRVREDGIVSDARALSMLELLIVSSLPKDWNLPENFKDSDVRVLIGEAIPPMLLYKMLEPIKEY